MKHLILAFVLTILALPAFAADKESAFDRIMRTGVIRCGYYVFPPVTYRDPNTGELSGMTVDYMNRLAERAALKIEWTAEVTWGNWVTELQAGRYDVACTPMWPELTKMKVVSFTDPLFFSGMYAVVRSDDPRFTKGDMSRLNKPDVTILTQEGDATDSVARAAFPNAKFYTIPSSAATSEYYQGLLAKKADALLTDRNGLATYEQTNAKGQVKILDDSKPLKIQSYPLVVLRGQTDLRDFLNQAIHELDYSGDTDRILRKWEPEPGKTYLRVNNAFMEAE